MISENVFIKTGCTFFSDKEHLGQRGLAHFQGERDTAQGGFPLTHRFYVGYARVFQWLYVRN